MRSNSWILIMIVMIWLAILILVPLGAVVRSAFESGPGPFLAALSAPEARVAFKLTALITMVAVVINVVFGTLLAIVLARHTFFGKMLLDELVSLPLAVSPVVAGFMFILLFGRNGWLGSWFERGGIQVIYAVPGMIIATIFVTLPFVAKEVVPVLREIGSEQETAALTLGANSWQTFWRVTFPSIRWGLIYGITLTVARAMGEFGAVLVVSGSIIGKTQTATLFIHQEFTDYHYQGAFSASLVLAAFSFVVLLIMDLARRFRESNETV